MGVGVRVTSLFPPVDIWTWQQVPLLAKLPPQPTVEVFDFRIILSLSVTASQTVVAFSPKPWLGRSV